MESKLKLIAAWQAFIMELHQKREAAMKVLILRLGPRKGDNSDLLRDPLVGVAA